MDNLSDIRKKYKRWQDDKRYVKSAGRSVARANSNLRFDQFLKLSQSGLSLNDAIEVVGMSEGGARRLLRRHLGNSKWPIAGD